MTTPELLSRVMKLWQPPAYYVLTEVRNSTGFNKREGYADVLAMSIWPSRGLELIGAELKVSRSDWMHEYKNPEKAEKFVRHCHRWYLITGPDVAKEEEIPTTWGWMVAGPNGLKTVKAAPTLNPQLPDWGFIASLFRNIGASHQGMVASSEVETLALKKADEMRERDRDSKDSLRQRIEELSKENSDLRNAVYAFSNASGVNLTAWRPDTEDWERKAKLFKLFMDHGHARVASGYQNQISLLEHQLRWMQQAVKDYEALTPTLREVQ